MKKYIGFLLNILKGAAIGVGAILPGVSGGVLCVVFGIYAPMMAFLAHPIKTFKASYKLLLPVLLGWVMGFLGLSRLVALLFTVSYDPVVWLFIGLIAGTLPSMYKTAVSRGRKNSDSVAMIVSFCLLFGLMMFLNITSPVSIQPSFIWWLICGLLWGVGLIVPGMSPSAILIWLGLYGSMSYGISRLDVSVVLPLLLGLVGVVLALSRLVNILYEKKFPLINHILVGIAAASAMAIVPVNADYSFTSCVIYLLCFAAGTICAFAFSNRKTD